MPDTVLSVLAFCCFVTDRPKLVLKTTICCSSSLNALGAYWAQMGSPCSDGGRSCSRLGWAGCTRWVTRHLSSHGFSMPSRGLPHSVESQGSQTASTVACHLQRSCELKFSYVTHSESKQTEMSEFAAEEGVLQN